MLEILENNNIKNIKTVIKDDNIIIEMRLEKSIVDMSKIGIHSAIFDFDDFIKSIFINNEKRLF